MFHILLNRIIGPMRESVGAIEQNISTLSLALVSRLGNMLAASETGESIDKTEVVAEVKNMDDLRSRRKAMFVYVFFTKI